MKPVSVSDHHMRPRYVGRHASIFGLGSRLGAVGVSKDASQLQCQVSRHRDLARSSALFVDLRAI